MNNRELLELAAKAAGIDGWFVEDDDWYGTGIVYTDPEDCNHTWNPLTDDGDALRLAVRLKLLIDCEYNRGIGVGSSSFEEVWEDKIPDPYAATRRAIVRAAAEIGMEMK